MEKLINKEIKNKKVTFLQHVEIILMDLKCLHIK